MGTRRRARELALQTLYALEFEGRSSDEALGDTRARAGEPASTDAELATMTRGNAEALAFHDTLVHGVLANRAAIDETLGACSTNWKVQRMALIDRNILRVAVYELQFMDDIPPKVTINEAIEIGKRYGTAESGAFINGILDRVASLKRR